MRQVVGRRIWELWEIWRRGRGLLVQFLFPGPPVAPQPYDSHRVADEESIAHYCKFTFDGFSQDSQHQGQEKQSYYRKKL